MYIWEAEKVAPGSTTSFMIPRLRYTSQIFELCIIKFERGPPLGAVFMEGLVVRLANVYSRDYASMKIPKDLSEPFKLHLCFSKCYKSVFCI